MSRTAMPGNVLSARVIPVLRGLDTDRVLEVAAVLRRNGIDVAEITMESPNAAASIEAAAGEGVIAGAGTVMSVAEAEAAVAAGAVFLVSPHTDFEIVRWAVDRHVPMVPGAFTPSEVAAVWSAGAAAVKIFPASIVGPGILKAIRGPFGDLPLIPTGGITADNARSYLDAGAVAVGVGGWLTNHADLEVVAERARATVEACTP